MFVDGYLSCTGDTCIVRGAGGGCGHREVAFIGVGVAALDRERPVRSHDGARRGSPAPTGNDPFDPPMVPGEVSPSPQAMVAVKPVARSARLPSVKPATTVPGASATRSVADVSNSWPINPMEAVLMAVAVAAPGAGSFTVTVMVSWPALA